MWEALEIARAPDFVATMPDRLESAISQGGTNVSGGQRQRLAIARVMLKRPGVLILDEASSSLDAESEALVQDALEHLMAGRTTLVISQRVTSVRWCERIVLLERGVITGLGTHEELLDSSPLYREIHSHQQLTRVPS